MYLLLIKSFYWLIIFSNLINKFTCAQSYLRAYTNVLVNY